MKMYKMIFLGIVSLVLLSACSNVNTEESRQIKEATKTSHSLTVPSVQVMVNEKQIEPKAITYQLKSGNKIKEVEKEPVYEASKEMKAVQAEPGALVQIYFDKSESIQKAFVRQWKNQTAYDMKVKDYRFEAPKEEGEYVYEVLTYYTNGHVQYVFKIKVEEQ